MELQFKKTICGCMTRVTSEVSAQELTQEVRLPDGMPDIGRVLTSWGQMVLRSKEWRGDTVTLIGGIMVWVLYAPEDGSEPRCIDSWVPYQLRWEHLDSGREGPVRISPMLRFVDTRTVAARKFMVRVGAAALAEVLCPSEMVMHSPEELPEDIELLRRTYPVRLQKESGEKTFQIDEDLPLPAAGVDRIISYTIYPEITDQRVLSNKVVFRGNGNLHLVYCCSEGRIRIQDFEIPFSQYHELEGTYSPDAQADIWLGATNLEVDLDEQGQLRVKCGMVAQYLIDDRELLELTEDAYSNRRMVEPRMESLFAPSVLEDRTETVGAVQQLNGHSGEVVTAEFSPDVPVQRRTSDGVSVELTGMFHVLYYDGNGMLQSGNARWEGDISLPADECSSMEARIIPQGQVRVFSEAEGFRLNGQLQVMIRTTSDSGLPVVTGIDVGELREQDPDRPTLILCRPGGEGLWKLAKRCGSTMDAIREANGLQEEPGDDRILLIPVN